MRVAVRPASRPLVGRLGLWAGNTSVHPARLLALRSLSTSARTMAQLDTNSYVNPYKGGPSALEKAVHLFFFTEIIRGMLYSCVLLIQYTT